jgi:hypothetical protein
MKKNYLKIAGVILLVILAISLFAAAVEINYCHSLTTTPPPYSSLDYIKTGTLCSVNGTVAVPGIALILLWKIIF